MRLVDQIMASSAAIAARDARGILHNLPGPGSRNDLIAQCPLRFVLDESASSQCMDLFLHGPDLLDLDPRAVRLPSSLLWIEWLSNPPYAETPNTRVGVLVESDEGGRSGSLFGFYCDAHGHAVLAPARMEFDLDAELYAPAASPNVFGLRHQGMAGLDRILRHALFHLERQWAAFMRSNAPDRAGHDIQQIGDYIWVFLPFVFAFSTLLNARGALSRRPSDLSRLNAARAKRGRPALLDHIEVRLALGGAGSEVGGGMGNGMRARARLHQVRGHLVQRAGRIFWRSAHMRGDATKIIARRTVSVTGSPPSGRYAEDARRSG
ncbi:MAG: hypothetical protein JWO81_2010 [Alphaproteobacteria bacterium]|nr:hypothetical protein [Alphaproteobacteria bacterium]